MRCPFCQFGDTRVVETRETAEDVTRRRRECLECKKRFTTYERVELHPLVIIKKNGTRESFDKVKVKSGILKSCEKRSVSLEEINKIVDEIELELRNEDKAEISSKKVGSLVMKKLKKLDEVAYIRFASVYRAFQDLGSFEKELQKLMKK
ncbi:MAG: transcriptional regulator NrdR [Nanoarchaeota archaeon]|nr:transcriptional regulator NrdR [Nanoarchaeota archaeon]MBU1269324.1 transcriptional regulator NrdR [Nanoarchaeota archaeon]MBU1604487.1 transcriptional regulator NrdR [Nanoarchaeota archaeon]MBU2443194.1 transcriptional regulator NrdR [Nanoarchaeota archaeon]